MSYLRLYKRCYEHAEVSIIILNILLINWHFVYLSPSKPAPMIDAARTYPSPSPSPPPTGKGEGVVGCGHGVAFRTNRYHHGIRHSSFKNTSVFDVQCSVFGVQNTSVFDVQCSVFGVQKSSVFDVPCSVFGVQNTSVFDVPCSVFSVRCSVFSVFYGSSRIGMVTQPEAPHGNP